MFLSVFDIFKIGIGPSSSHTVGPMVAARRFVDEDLRPLAGRARRLVVSLHGSLAFTGKGHGTDRAIALAAAGEAPDTVDPDRVPAILEGLAESKSLAAVGLPEIVFDPADDIRFDYGPALPGHANGMIFRALDAEGAKLTEHIFYSVGGGFVARADELAAAGGRGDCGRRSGKPASSLSFRQRRGDAGDGQSLRPFDRGSQASERGRPCP